MTLAMKLDEEREVAALGNTVSVIRKGKGKGSDDFLMSVLGLDKDQFIEISDMLDNNPDKSDWDIANTILYG